MHSCAQEISFEVQGNIGYGDWSAPATTFDHQGAYLHGGQLVGLYAISFIIIGGSSYSILFIFSKKGLRLQHELKLKFEEANRLKELDTFKSQVYTNLTHEFRTPLTVILGMTRQLKARQWPV